MTTTDQAPRAGDERPPAPALFSSPLALAGAWVFTSPAGKRKVVILSRADGKFRYASIFRAQPN